MPAWKWNRILLPALAALTWFACDTNEPAGPEQSVSGAARVAVPALAAGYLTPGSHAVFYLDVTGPGMAPIHYSAALAEGKPINVVISDIPIGAARVFHGLLVRVDSTQRDTLATHEGSDTVAIAAGPATDVHLYLKSLGAGAARVCLDVEGWPANPACDTLPKPPPLANVTGCYNLVVTKHGPTEDSLFKGKLRLTQTDSSVFAVVTWGANAKDSASGGVYLAGSQASIYLAGQFTLKAYYDSGKGLYGGFYAGPAGIDGDANALPSACDTIVPPNQTVRFDSVECWKVSQTTTDGRAMQGTLWAGWRAASLTGWFQWNWNNAAFAVSNGTAPASGAVLYLYGTLPGGFGHPMVNAIEWAHYKAQFSAAGLNMGAAYARAGASVSDFTSSDKFADWNGLPYACPDQARTKLASLVKM